MIEMEVRTRREAAEAGLAKYFTGRECKRGHAGLRYTSTGTCVHCGSANNRRLREAYKNARTAAGLTKLEVEIHKDDVPAVRSLVEALAAARSLV